MESKKDFFFIYFGGELFNHKDLTGNAFLAEAIYRVSGGKYRCALPQNFEQRKANPKSIRDEDILNLIQCDAAIFNYDGAELDSGTVVEFMFAKFADIPSLIVRTDFRTGGDCDGEGSFPWNLMTSFYPRTRVILANAASDYKVALRNYFLADGVEYSSAMSGSEIAKIMTEAIAKRIVEGLDGVIGEKPKMPGTLSESVFEWLKDMPNFENPKSRERIALALRRKKEKKLL